MYILLRNETRGMVDGVLLAAGANAMRVAIPGNVDTLELRLLDGAWLANGEKFGLEALVAGSNLAMINLGDALRAKAFTACMRNAD
jgi:hypothetical protein